MPNFGNYILLEKICDRDLAELFRAKWIGNGGFEKDVAIQRFPESLSVDEQFAQVLLFEAGRYRRINHSNFVQLLTLEWEDHCWALVMEYVEGVSVKTLHGVLQEEGRRLGTDESIFIVQEILDALDYLHTMSAADENLYDHHGNLSPWSVMITNSGQIKLCDFFLARMTSGHPGKIKYKPPECLGGARADARADVYSAALLLWELLAGEEAYQGMGRAQMLRSAAEAHVPPIEALRDELPDALKHVLDRALAPHPGDRYPDAAAFLRALAKVDACRDRSQSRRSLAEIVRALRGDPAPRRQPQVLEIIAEPTLEEVLDGPVVAAEQGLEAALDGALTDPDA